MKLLNLFYLLIFFVVGFLSGCNNRGIQGGDLKNKFTGVETAKALSPTTIQINWSLDDRYNSFNVYMGGSDKPLKTETFSQSLVSGLLPNTTYPFTVTGIKSDGTGAEEGFSNSFSGKTLPSFSGIKSEMISERTKNSVRFKFVPSSDVVSYYLYSKIRNADWNFANSVDQGSSATEILLSANGLAGGTTYCFFIVARYLDGTSEPKTDVPADVDSKAICETTENSIPPASVTMNSIVPGNYPWFLVSGGADTNTKVEIRRLKNDQIIASRQGVGELRSSVPVEFGPEQFYAITSTAFGIAYSNISLVPVPTGERANQSYLRNIASDRADPKGPLFPELINGGKGIQKLGSKLATGDFNCDGLPDVAVSAPEATPFGDPASPSIDENHYIKTGAVVVYYGKEVDELDSNGVKIGTKRFLNSTAQPLPTNSAPEPQLMYYPMNQSNTLIGSQLAVGNINGDCRSLKINGLTGKLETQTVSCDSIWSTAGQTGQADRSQIATCDDLAFSSNEGAGAVYVLYGNPNSGLTNTQGAQPGVNDFACVSGGSCQAMKYTAVGTNFTDTDGDLSKYQSFGKSLSFGDFDNDGFDELAIGANHAGSRGVVMILKGSDSGLYAPVYNTIPTVGYFNKGGTKLDVVYDAATSFEDISFGFSVTSVPDSRLCSGRTDAGAPAYPNVVRNLFPDEPNRLAKQDYDFSKCDDLVIGVPQLSSSRGSIFSCAAVLNNATFQISKWVCQQHRPFDGQTGDEYGYSVLGLRNLNSYPMGSSRTSQPANVTGALVVGAPGRSTSVGLAYIYYVTPFDADDKLATAASGFGGIQKVLSDATTNITFTAGAATADVTHQIEAIDATACDYTNQNRSSAGVRWAMSPTGGDVVDSCFRQSISMQPALARARFGEALSLLPDMSANDTNRFLMYSGAPMLAISAPGASVPSVVDSSVNISEHGQIKIFQLDVSDAVSASGGTSSYPFRKSSNSTYYYGGGVNPFGSITVNPGDLTAGSRFGRGGVVGGYFYKDPLPSLIQVIGGADGRTVGSASLNGSLSVFKAKTKQLTYIEQKCTGTCPSGLSNLEIAPNISIETSYHFEMAQVGGDFNGDGFEDVVARSVLGDRVRIVVYYGSANGLVRSPAPSRLAIGLEPLLLEFDADPEMGLKFSRVGSVNGDAFDDLLLVGAKGAYVFYGSFAGLVANSDPSTAPNGTYPLWFGRNLSSPSIYLFASSKGSNINGSTLPSDFEVQSYNQGNDGITSGDYNGDGYSDIAFSVKETSNETVLVVFGGANGSQVNRITNPGRFLSTDLIDWDGSKTTNSTTCNVADSNLQSAAHCLNFGAGSSALTPGKALRIRSPATWASGQIEFGRKLTSLRPDSSNDSSSFTNKTWSLVIADRIVSATVNQSNIYTFAVQGNAMKTSGAYPALTLKSVDNNYAFTNILRIAGAGDVNGDKVQDVLIASDNDAEFTGSAVRMIYGKTGALVSYPTYNDNKTKITENTEVIPFLQGALSTEKKYGMGIGSVRDFNGDGFDDIFINVPKGDNISSTATLLNTGYVIIVFGSSKGIRIKSGTVYSTPSATPKCYGGTDEYSVCEPYMVFLPDSKEKEYTYVSEKSVGDINGDGIPDLLIGGYGRDNVFGAGYATGVVYVLY